MGSFIKFLFVNIYWLHYRVRKFTDMIGVIWWNILWWLLIYFILLLFFQLLIPAYIVPYNFNETIFNEICTGIGIFILIESYFTLFWKKRYIRLIAEYKPKFSTSKSLILILAPYLIIGIEAFLMWYYNRNLK